MSELDSIILPGHFRAYLFSNADGKEWLVPVKHMRTGLELYQPSGAKGVALKRALPFSHKLGAVRRLANMKMVDVQLLPELMTLAEKAFGESDLEFSIFGGTPSVHCKVTIQFFKGSRILGYAKVSASDDIAQLFKHEQGVFDSLAQAGIADVPRCLHCGQLSDGRAVFIQSTVKTLKSKVCHSWLPLHDQFLYNLHKRTKVEISFEQSDIAQSLSQLKSALCVIPLKYREIIEPILSEEYNSRLGCRCEFSAFHADFTPWNMLIQDGRLFVFDWEYARFSYPPFLDRYHFLIQQAIHVSHESPEIIYEQLRKQEWFDRSDLRLYLLDILSRFINREKRGMSDQLLRLVAIWVDLLQISKHH